MKKAVGKYVAGTAVAAAIGVAALVGLAAPAQAAPQTAPEHAQHLHHWPVIGIGLGLGVGIVI